jgi:hypothetical protein
MSEFHVTIGDRSFTSRSQLRLHLRYVLATANEGDISDTHDGEWLFQFFRAAGHKITGNTHIVKMTTGKTVRKSHFELHELDEELQPKTVERVAIEREIVFATRQTNRSRGPLDYRVQRVLQDVMQRMELSLQTPSLKIVLNPVIRSENAGDAQDCLQQNTTSC